MKESLYKVTVIIPVYNQEHLITRALDSIPNREDIEIIVIDDGSTDNSRENAINWTIEKHRANVTIPNKREHKGIAFTVNQGYDLAEGEYIVLLGSDDYFYTDKFEECINELDGTDIVYFNAIVNIGKEWDLNEESADLLCGSYRFTKRTLIGDDRCDNKQWGEDRTLWDKIKEKPHTKKFTHIPVKHYNHPRENSISDLHDRGIIE